MASDLSKLANILLKIQSDKKINDDEIESAMSLATKYDLKGEDELDSRFRDLVEASPYERCKRLLEAYVKRFKLQGRKDAQQGAYNLLTTAFEESPDDFAPYVETWRDVFEDFEKEHNIESIFK